MRRLTACAAAVGCLLAVGSAHAGLIIIDDFYDPLGSPRPVITDTSASLAANSGVAGLNEVLTNSPSRPLVAATRQVYVQKTTDTSGAQDGEIEARYGEGPLGNLKMSVTGESNGFATVTWSINSFTLPPGPASFLFKVIFSDTGEPVLPTAIDFAFDGAGTNDFNFSSAIGGGSNFSVPFALGATEAGYLAGGGTLVMRVEGTPGWELTLDQVNLETPEPTSIALVGLALLGAGVASRRRKS